MFPLPVLFWSGCAAPTEGLPRDGIASVEESTGADSGERDVVAGSLVEGTVRTCPSPENREVSPTFSPPQPGDLAAVQERGTDEAPTGWGLAVADFDGDGKADLFLPQRTKSELYRGDGGGGFTRVDGALPAADGVPALGASAADYDGDGDLDLFVAREGPDALWRNDGGTFVDVTEAAGLGADPYLSVSGSWGDRDGDGDLDLFVATHFTEGLHDQDTSWRGDPNRFWENHGDGTFVERSELLAVSPDAAAGFSHLGAWWDVDGDLRPELHIVNDKGQLGFTDVLLASDGDALVDRSAGSGLDISPQGMGLAAGELNGDDVPDFLVTDWGHLWLLMSDGAGGWYDAAAARGLGLPLDDDRYVAWGVEIADLDVDGDEDVVVAFGPDDLEKVVTTREGVPSTLDQPDGLWLQEDGAFVQRADAWAFDDRAIERGFVLADLDGNGWLDFVRRDLAGGAWVTLQGCGEAAWLEVALAGPAPNTRGIGARVEVEADGLRWVRWVHAGSTNVASSAPPEVHVGLGDVDAIDVLRVTWPDGGVQEFANVAPRQRVTVVRE